MVAPLAKSRKTQGPVDQAIKHGEELLKEEHRIIYKAFLGELERNFPKENIYEKIFDFVLQRHKDVNQLSEKDFSQLLLSIFKEIKAKGLAKKENLRNGKIEQVVDGCIASEAWKTFKSGVKTVLFGWIPFKDLLRRVPYLGKLFGDKEEENEKQPKSKSDTKVVVTFLLKLIFPIVVFVASLLIAGPTAWMVGLGLFGLSVTVIKLIAGLFSNNEVGTVHNPDGGKGLSFSTHVRSPGKEAAKHADEVEKAKCEQEMNKWIGKFHKDIGDILQNTQQEASKANAVNQQVTGQQEKQQQQAQATNSMADQEIMSQTQNAPNQPSTDKSSWVERTSEENKVGNGHVRS